MTTDADVIVVGAGLAGLAAAAAARQAGHRVMVVEAHLPGGRARTVEREGFTLNMGAHALFRSGAGITILTTLGVTPEGVAPPLAHYRALVGGALHLLPTGPASLLRTGAVGARSKAQLAGLLGRLPRLGIEGLHHTSVAEWLVGCHLRPDAESVVRALIRLSTYSDDVETLSAGAALGQLQLATKGGVLYLHRGWAQLTDGLSRSLDIRAGVDVQGLDHTGGAVEVRTSEGTLVASRVVVATGGPAAVRRILPADPDWGELGPPVTAACLDLGLSKEPEPGYVLSLDDPVYATVQSPPARQTPGHGAVVAAIRYGARNATVDRAQLEGLTQRAGVDDDDVVVRRFLAHMTVSGALPVASSGGLAGRPDIGDTGVPGVTMAGDWIGPVGLLADASLASGYRAGRRGGQDRPGSTKMVA
jgi:phytoene dehydrogenase-like protein